MNLQSVIDEFKKKTSAHAANEARIHQLRVPADASEEEIQEAVKKLFEKQSEYIDVQGKSILKTTSQALEIRESSGSVQSRALRANRGIRDQ